MRASSGFTLIELMIVIAILGILLAIAIPAYNDYTIRARISEGLVVASGAKSAVSEARQATSIWPTGNDSAGIRSGGITSTYVASVTVGTEGTVEVAFRNIDSQVNSSVVVLIPTMSGNTVRWDCSGGNVEMRFRPAACRL